MFSSLKEIGTANVDDSGKTLGRVYDEIVIFKHLELTEFLALGRFVQDPFIDGLRLAKTIYKHRVHLEPSH